MKKALLFFGLMIVGASARAATQVYIPSTSTFNNYRMNIASGSIRNLQVQTSTFGWVSASSGSITNLSITNISTGSASLANLSVTGAVIGTTTITQASIGISTITNGTINNAQLGSVFSTGTWSLQATTINGTATDNSTKTYTAVQTFRNVVQVSTGMGTSAVFSVNNSSVVVGASGAPGLVYGTQTNNDAPAGFVGEYLSSSCATSISVVTSAQYMDVCLQATLTLTPGDWDINGVCFWSRNGATYTGTGVECGIGTATGNNSAGVTNGDTDSNQDSATGAAWTSLNLVTPIVRKSVAATTTIYLKGYPATFSAGNPTVRGRISARRIR